MLANVPTILAKWRMQRGLRMASGDPASPRTAASNAAVSARYAEDVRPPARPLPDAETQYLCELIARRQQIVGIVIAGLKSRRELGNVRLRRTVEQVMETLQEQLSTVEAEIDAIRGNPAWAERDALRESVPGVGPTIARICIAELPELGHLGRRQIGALGGAGAIQP